MTFGPVQPITGEWNHGTCVLTKDKSWPVVFDKIMNLGDKFLDFPVLSISTDKACIEAEGFVTGDHRLVRHFHKWAKGFDGEMSTNTCGEEFKDCTTYPGTRHITIKSCVK